MQVHQASGMVKIEAGVTIDEAFSDVARAMPSLPAGWSVMVAKNMIERRLRFAGGGTDE